MDHLAIAREWDAETFHRRVLEVESVGYVVRRETYSIIPEMNPETGEIIHLHTLELCKPDPQPGLAR